MPLVAYRYLFAGDYDHAIDWLEKAYERPESDSTSWKEATVPFPPQTEVR